MTSQRNNRLQQRRQELREQQKNELKALTAFDKLLEAEETARSATARHVADFVASYGADRAAMVFGLETKEVAAYVKLAAASDSTEQTEEPELSSDSSNSAPGASGSVPGQSVPERADASV